MKIKFLGAASTVTGSKHVLELDQKKFLIDCGQLQGPDENRFNPKTFDFKKINEFSAIFITHAHIDHCGYLPYLIRKGYVGNIYTTKETFDLMKISLEDSANLLKENVEVEKRKDHFFYDKNDVHSTLSRVKILNPGKVHVEDDLEVAFFKSGHILGACFIKFKYKNKNIVFSGDLGRFDSLLHNSPEAIGEVDYLVVESTYGDKLHEKIDHHDYFKNLFEEIISGNKTLIIPAFSIDRTQGLINIMTTVLEENSMNLPLILTGPMGLEVTKLYEKYSENLKIKKTDFERINKHTRHIYYQNELQHFWQTSIGPKIVIAGGGMLTGGTILGHLKAFATKDNSIVLITGYQASDTLGRKLLDGERKVKVEELEYEIKADVRFISGLSAHADQNDILKWINTSNMPKEVFVVHGEEKARRGLKDFLSQHIRSKIYLPTEGEIYNLAEDKKE